MNRLDLATRRQIAAALVEGCSIRSICRMTGAAKGTVLKCGNRPIVNSGIGAS